MSKNVKIKEGNNPRTFWNVSRIRINDTNGSSLWMPEDEAKLETKHISENGTYKASEEVDDQGVSKGLYGYSEVTVSGIGTATGIGADGNEHTISTDENDNFVDTSVPSLIKIDKKPNTTKYSDGAEISLEGAKIQGYMKKGEKWEGDESHPNGVIPNSELTLEPDHASLDDVDEYSADIKDKTGIDDYWKNQIPIGYTVGLESITQMDDGGYKGGREDGGSPIEWIETEDTVYVLGFTFTNTTFNQSDFILCAVSLGEFSFLRVRHNAWGVYEAVIRSSEYTVNNKRFQYAVITSKSAFIEGWELTTNIPLQEVEPMANVPKSLAYHAGYIVLFGDREGGTQEIKVNWNRIVDSKVLSDTFKIEVEPKEEDEEEDEDFDFDFENGDD